MSRAVPSAEALRDAVRQAVASGDANAEATARVNLAAVLQADGDPTALQEFEAALSATRRAGSVRSEAILLLNFIPVLLDNGEADRALALAERAAEITERGVVDHYVLARLLLGRVWIEGFAEAATGLEALRDAADAFEGLRKRAAESAAQMAVRYELAFLQAGKVAVAARDVDLAIRLIGLVNPEQARQFAQMTAQGDEERAIDVEALRAHSIAALDEALGVWRAARTEGRTGGATSVPTPLAQAARSLASAFGWDDARAAAAETATPANRDPAHPSRGGPAGIVMLADYVAGGALSIDTAIELARELAVDDDDLAFLIAVPGRDGQQGPRRLGPLLEIIGHVARDDAFAAKCLRVLAAFAARDGESHRVAALLERADARLAAGIDDRLRAEVLNEQAVLLSGRGEYEAALARASQAQELAQRSGADAISRMAQGNAGHALLALGSAQEALDVFEQLAQAQEEAHDETGLEITRFNIAAARMALGQGQEPALEPESAQDPDRIFLSAQSLALKGELDQALAAFEHGFQQVRDGQRYPREAQARLNQANALLKAQRNDDAAVALRQAAQLFRRQGDRRGELQALIRLAAPQLSPLPAAQSAAERAVKLARTLESPQALAEALDVLGAILVLRHHAREGLAALAESHQLAPTPTRAFALAQAQVAAGHPDAALPLLNQAVDASAGETAEHRMLALAGRAEALAALGRRDDALLDLREAEMLASVHPPSALGAETANRLGWLLVESAVLAEGIGMLERALGWARSAAAAEVEIGVLNNLGMALNESGDMIGARSAFETARDAARARGDALREGTAVFGLGNVALSEHRRDEARERYREAIGLASVAGNIGLEAAATDSLALTFLQAGDAASAIELQQRAAGLHRQLRRWVDHVADLSNLTSSYVMLRDRDAAAATLRAAQLAQRRHRIDILRPQLRLNAAQIEAMRGDWNVARRSYRAALQAIEATQSQWITPAEQRRWRSRRVDAYLLAVEDAVMAGDAGAAIEFLECNRTRYFEAVALRRGARPLDLPEAVMRRFEQAADHLDDLRRRRRAQVAGRDAALEHEIALAQSQLDALRQLVDAARDPRRDPKPPRFAFPKLATLAAAIPAGAAAVSISLHNRGTAIVVIGRYPDGGLWTATQMESALDRNLVSQLVLGDASAWREARSFDDIDDAALGWISVSRLQESRLWQRALAHIATELGARLWPAIEAVIGARARELILLPGAGFAVLPLHAARLRDGSRAQDRYAIRYAPSLKLLANSAHHPMPRRDVVLGQIIPPATDLPFAEVEVTRVAERFGAVENRRVAAADATPDHALALFEAADVVHFAGHGAFDAAEPLLSRLLCAGESGQADAPLTVRALIEHGRQLRCSLAILSACDTGRVDAIDSMNDALGLPGALLAAGCGGVIATLWPVFDIAAALVLDETLAHWPARQPLLPVALAEATRWLREASGTDIATRLVAWRDAHPPFAELLSRVIVALQRNPEDRPFGDEVSWAAFHVVGQPEPRRRGAARLRTQRRAASESR